MNSKSFKFKIIGTLVVGIILFSIAAFTIYSSVLKSRLIAVSEENIEHINLLRDQFYFSIAQHDGRIIRTMLKSIEKDNDVLRTFLVDSDLRVVYPKNIQPVVNDTANLHSLMALSKDVTMKTYRNEPIPFNRFFIRMQNNPSCYSCHHSGQKNLGMIIMDLKNFETEKIIAFTWKFSFIYTVFLLISIFLLVAYLHYRYIRRSLNHFRTAISLINQGKLEARLSIPSSAELGALGKSFNNMLDTFEKTQAELNAYHQKELHNSQKMATIGEMSARIAHEIRNPVTGIARAMDIIIADSQEERNKPILEEIQRQASRVEQAISNLLKYSRSQEIRVHTGDINEVIKSMVFFLRHQAYDKPVNFLLDLGDNIPDFPFDHELLENVLLNLSFNSVNFLGDNGTIVYRTQYNSVTGCLTIAVCDNGRGIPEGVTKEIFKPFFTTNTKGTGLGLAISKDIIEKHNGKIWFSNNEEAGCTFFISLPVKAGHKC